MDSANRESFVYGSSEELGRGTLNQERLGRKMNVQKEKVADLFGSRVFSDAVMRERLPKDVYKALRKTIDEGKPLSSHVADVVANTMKDWALELGATHYCHWFQPMTGATAEKHDSFIAPTAEGKTMMVFSGKELTQAEPDASSFPSGGLRATFEARGYTAWDYTSPVFIKKDGENIALFIPSAFCSYTGEALDKKTPLLRSMEALDREAMRVLKALGHKGSKRVFTSLGNEQEYFLVDRAYVEKRLDLQLCGRTLFGAPSPKGHELDDHYFGSIDERVASFMNEVNTELWRLGISAKTQHNEVAPAQYEIAPIYATVNVGTDHNQLTMETLRKVAKRHGFVCLLHEKPFAGVNGSGKHNNWSMVTDDGVNLLEPGNTPHENEIFLVFLCAVIKAVDKYQELLRAAVATAGNDHRLGANEAPPAIVSVFLGEQLTDIFEQLGKGGAKTSKRAGDLKLGTTSLPPLAMDVTDRNRTSPFAFTGNKFEFRMVGSALSPAGPNFVLNAIVADVLAEIADTLQKAKDGKSATAQKICKQIANEHMRIVFNGDNYNAAWEREAKRRGLANHKNTVEALKPVLGDKQNAEVFDKHKVLSPTELEARIEILHEVYTMQINIEALLMLDIGRRQVAPAGFKFAERLAGSVSAVKAAGGKVAGSVKLLKTVSALNDELAESLDALEAAQLKAAKIEKSEKRAESYCRTVIPAMNAVREKADALERKVDADLWPLPTYAEMLFNR